jgi:hypothetical protein
MHDPCITALGLKADSRPDFPGKPGFPGVFLTEYIRGFETLIYL